MTAREEIRGVARVAGWHLTPALTRDTFVRRDITVDVFYTPLDAVSSGLRTEGGDNESTNRHGKKDTVLGWLLQGPSPSPEARGATREVMLEEFERARRGSRTD